MAIKPAGISNWLPGASVASGAVSIPKTAFNNTLLGATPTPSDDIRQILMGALDSVYSKYQADKTDDGSAPTTFTILRSISADKVQFLVAINTTGTASLPTYS